MCLSARIFQKPRPNFTKFSVYVTCGRDSVGLWRQCDSYVGLLPVLWITSTFHIIERMGRIGDDAYVSSSSPRRLHRGEVCRLWLHLLVVIIIIMMLLLLVCLRLERPSLPGLLDVVSHDAQRLSNMKKFSSCIAASCGWRRRLLSGDFQGRPVQTSTALERARPPVGGGCAQPGPRSIRLVGNGARRRRWRRAVGIHLLSCRRACLWNKKQRQIKAIVDTWRTRLNI